MGLMDATMSAEERAAEEAREAAEYAELQSRERAEELRRNAGEPVGDMPPVVPDDLPPEPVEHPEPIGTPRVDGTTQLQMVDGGGPHGTLKFKGAKCEVTHGTDFELGEVVEFRFAAVVRERGQVQSVDAKTGHVETRMAYALEVEDVMRVAGDEGSILEDGGA